MSTPTFAQDNQDVEPILEAQNSNQIGDAGFVKQPQKDIEVDAELSKPVKNESHRQLEGDENDVSTEESEAPLSSKQESEGLQVAKNEDQDLAQEPEEIFINITDNF